MHHVESHNQNQGDDGPKDETADVAVHGASLGVELAPFLYDQVVPFIVCNDSRISIVSFESALDEMAIRRDVRGPDVIPDQFPRP
jgi:hypothetical protein